nr:MAG TPA: hypothetical protein [Caudoviricetes sp.]
MSISKFNNEECCSPVGSVKHRPNRQVRPFGPPPMAHCLSSIRKNEHDLPSGLSSTSALPLPEILTPT